MPTVCPLKDGDITLLIVKDSEGEDHTKTALSIELAASKLELAIDHYLLPFQPNKFAFVRGFIVTRSSCMGKGVERTAKLGTGECGCDERLRHSRLRLGSELIPKWEPRGLNLRVPAPSRSPSSARSLKRVTYIRHP